MKRNSVPKYNRRLSCEETMGVEGNIDYAGTRGKFSSLIMCFRCQIFKLNKVSGLVIAIIISEKDHRVNFSHDLRRVWIRKKTFLLQK